MAVELANAYVTLSVETSNISRQVGKMFSGVETQAGNTGRNMGRSMATSFEKAKPNVEVLEADVKRAQDRVVAHKESGSRKMESANRKVEIAQARVNEVTKKYGPDSSQALRAQDQLITAQQKAESEAMNYHDSLGRLEGKLKDSQTALADAARAAEDSGTMWDRMGDKLANAGDKMHNVGDRFKAAGQSIGDVGMDLTKKITVPIGGAIAAAGGLTAALGFKRLVGIDTAKAQIQGLGYDADKVMQDVDKGLMNTATSMADGASVARSALATGNIEIGQDLEDQINRVANVSAAYGIESEHAGYLLNNVLTKNKVTWGDLSQMQQNQIPIVSNLADHYGVTGEEIEKMAQEGKISIEDLNQVLDDNAGKSAEEYAKSWQGVTDNIGAYISRLGADALGGLFETMKVEASGLVDVLSSEKASEFATAIGEHLAVALQKVIGFVRGLVGWFVDLSPIWQKVIVGAIGFAVALGPILIVVGKIVSVVGSFIGVIGTITAVMGGLIAGFRGVALAAGASRAAIIAQSVATKLAAGAQRVFNAVLKANPIGLIITAITLLVAALVWFFTKTEVGQELWSKFTDMMVTAWEWVTEKIGAGAMWLWEEAIQPAFQAISDFWSNTLVPALQTAWESGIKPVFEGIGTVVMWLWGNIIKPYIGFITGLWMSLGEVFMWVWDKVLSPVFDFLGTAVIWLWTHIISPYLGFIGTLWSVIFAGMKLAWDYVLKPVFTAIGVAAAWLWEHALEPAFTWIGEHWSSIMDIMAGAWKYVLEPVFTAIGFVATALWEYVLKPVFSFIGEHWDKILTGMLWVWDYILEPVFSAVAFVATWLWEKVLSPVFTFIGDHWHLIVDGMKWVWDYILYPVWLAIEAIAVWLWEKVLEPVFRWIGDHWEEILFAMKYIWENHLKPAWERMKSVATWLWEKLSDIFSWIGNKWDSMSTTMTGVYNDYIKPVFDRFKSAADSIKSTFETVVEAIKTAWNRLIGITRAPVNFVINDVYNKGIVPLFNAMVGTFGLDSWKLSKADPVGSVRGGVGSAGFYAGGYTGPGAKYDPAGIVHADEYVLRKESTNKLRKAIGLEGLDYINKYGTLPGHASGGLVRPVGGRVTSGFGAGRGRYPHAGIDFAAPIGTPVKAALPGTVARTGWNVVPGRTGIGVFLNHPGGRNTYYGHLSNALVRSGESVAKGQTIARSGNTGRSTGPHLHFETWTGGNPVNPANYLSGASLPAGDSSGGLFGFDPAEKIKDFISGVVGKVTGKFDGKFPEAIGEGVSGYFGDAVDKAVERGQRVMQFLPGPLGTTANAFAASGNAQNQVKDVAGGYGWGSGSEWSAIQQLVQKESGWNPNAANPVSSARGLFQKMTSAHGAVEGSAGGQAQWGLNYIRQRYGTPTKALAFHNRNNWYDKGGLVGSITRDNGGVVPPGSSVINNWTRDPEWMYTNKQQDTVQAALDIAKNGAGARMVFNAPVYMRDEDDFIEAYNRKARRSRAVGTVSTL